MNTLKRKQNEKWSELFFDKVNLNAFSKLESERSDLQTFVLRTENM